MSEAATIWIKEHVQDDAQFFGNALVVEHRYIDSVVNGMLNDGLEVLTERRFAQ